MKKQLKYVTEKLKESVKELPKDEHKKIIGELKQRLDKKEEQMRGVSRIFSESQHKIEYLERVNKKLSIEYQQEKDIHNKIMC